MSLSDNLFPVTIEDDSFIVMFPGIGQIKMTGLDRGIFYEKKPQNFLEKLFKKEPDMIPKSIGSFWYEGEDFYYVDGNQRCRLIEAGMLTKSIKSLMLINDTPFTL